MTMHRFKSDHVLVLRIYRSWFSRVNYPAQPYHEHQERSLSALRSANACDVIQLYLTASSSSSSSSAVAVAAVFSFNNKVVALK
ncbi:hypothetical protein M0804_010896 [Polistes exclamans]|nr:hypothetical protein M0804_010896 [Polistes exclamans]